MIFLIESSVLIAIIALLRTFFKAKIKYCYLYALWAIVLVRLLVPVTFFESPLSVANLFDSDTENSTSVTMDNDDEYDVLTVYDYLPSTDIDADYDAGVTEDNGTLYKTSYQPGKTGIAGTDTNTDIKNDELPTGNEYLMIAFLPFWAAGAFIVFLIFLISDLRLRSEINQDKTLYKKEGKLRVYQTGHIASPCLYGFFRPAIYLPKHTCKTWDEETLSYVILHEMTHYRHKDHIISCLRIVLLCLLWFHPFVWLAAYLSKKDAELACDESVIKNLDEEAIYAYGQALLDVAGSRKHPRILHSMTTMSRQGKSLEERIRAITERRRYSLFLLIPVIFLSLAAILITFTGKATKKDTTEITTDTVSATEAPDTKEYRIEGDYVLTKANKKFLKKIYKVLPDEIVSELKENSYVTENGSVTSAANALENPTLCLDFDIKYGHLVQYINKENGFIDTLSQKKCSEEDAKKLVKNFAKVMLGRTLNIQEIKTCYPYDGYDTPDYVTLTDYNGGTYLVWLTHSMIIRYDAEKLEKKLEETDTATQIAFLSSLKDTWYEETPEYCDKPASHYMVTDMNQNGRLEIVVSHMGGTGQYTHSSIYEINEDMDSLVKCKVPSTHDSEADIMRSYSYAFKDYEKPVKTFYYLFEDSIKKGAADVEIRKSAFTLKDGVFKENILSTMNLNATELENYDGKDATYNKNLYKEFKTYNKFLVTFGWKELSKTSDLTGGKLSPFLQKSYNDFQFYQLEACFGY